MTDETGKTLTYRHTFWAMAMAVALALWWLTLLSDSFVSLGAIVAAVLFGWVVTMLAAREQNEGGAVATVKYRHTFWGMAIAVALALWWLTLLSPQFVSLGLVVCAVLFGWVLSMMAAREQDESKPPT